MQNQEDGPRFQGLFSLFIFLSPDISDISFHKAEILAYLIGRRMFWVQIDSDISYITNQCYLLNTKKNHIKI